jgi:hypothetical protein
LSRGRWSDVGLDAPDDANQRSVFISRSWCDAFQRSLNQSDDCRGRDAAALLVILSGSLPAAAEAPLRLRVGWVVVPADIMTLIYRRELYTEWVFTKEDYYRDPQGLPNLDALQANVDLAHKLGFLHAKLEIAKSEPRS